MRMTVYELIRELARYPADEWITFTAGIGQGEQVDLDIDEIDQEKGYAKPVIIKLLEV